MIGRRITNQFQQFKKRYYNPTIRGISHYIKPITDVGGSVGEGIYALKAFLPYRYMAGADLAAKALMGTQRAVDVIEKVAKAPSYASAIENSKRIVPALQVAKDLYGEYRHNSLINQARAQYNQSNDTLTMPQQGSRAYEFMRTLGTNDRMSNRAD